MCCYVRSPVENMRRDLDAHEASTIDGRGAVSCRLRIIIVLYPCREKLERSNTRY